MRATFLFKWMIFTAKSCRLGVAGERSSQGHPGSSGSVATAVDLDQAGTGLGHHHLGGLDSELRNPRIPRDSGEARFFKTTSA